MSRHKGQSYTKVILAKPDPRVEDAVKAGIHDFIASHGKVIKSELKSSLIKRIVGNLHGIAVEVYSESHDCRNEHVWTKWRKRGDFQERRCQVCKLTERLSYDLVPNDEQ